MSATHSKGSSHGNRAAGEGAGENAGNKEKRETRYHIFQLNSAGFKPSQVVFGSLDPKTIEGYTWRGICHSIVTFEIKNKKRCQQLRKCIDNWNAENPTKKLVLQELPEGDIIPGARENEFIRHIRAQKDVPGSEYWRWEAPKEDSAAGALLEAETRDVIVQEQVMRDDPAAFGYDSEDVDEWEPMPAMEPPAAGASGAKRARVETSAVREELELVALQAKLGQAQTDLVLREMAIDSLEEDNQGLKRQVVMLESANEALTAETRSLKAANEALTAETRSFKAANEALAVECQSLALKAASPAADSETGALKATIAKLEASKARHQKEFVDRINVLKAHLSDAKGKARKAEEERDRANENFREEQQARRKLEAEITRRDEASAWHRNQNQTISAVHGDVKVVKGDVKKLVPPAAPARRQ